MLTQRRMLLLSQNSQSLTGCEEDLHLLINQYGNLERNRTVMKLLWQNNLNA